MREGAGAERSKAHRGPPSAFTDLDPTFAGELTGDLGSGGAAGEVYLHDIAGGEGTAAAGLYLAVNRNVTGLNEHSRLGAVLDQICQL